MHGEGGTCVVKGDMRDKGGGHAWRRGCAWQKGACMAGGMHGRRTCMAGGMCGRGHAWQRACMAGGHVWWGAYRSMAGGMCDRGTCVAGETATGEDGMYPTGMHSCYE